MSSSADFRPYPTKGAAYFVLPKSTASTHSIAYEVDPKVAGSLYVKITVRNDFAEDYDAPRSYKPLKVLLHQYNGKTHTLKYLKHQRIKTGGTLIYNMLPAEIDNKYISYVVAVGLESDKVVSHCKLEISYPKVKEMSKVAPIPPGKKMYRIPKTIPKINK